MLNNNMISIIRFSFLSLCLFSKVSLYTMHFKIMVITLCCSYGIPINAIGASERKALNEVRLKFLFAELALNVSNYALT